MKWMACGALLLGVCLSASAQKIKGRYVSKVQEDGTIYHTFPETLFSSREAGDLTFDITYKTRQDGTATVNFTYYAAQAAPSDSVRFEAGTVTLAGPVEKIYIEPEKKRWVPAIPSAWMRMPSHASSIPRLNPKRPSIRRAGVPSGTTCRNPHGGTMRRWPPKSSR